jgi:hypothetical protein
MRLGEMAPFLVDFASTSSVIATVKKEAFMITRDGELCGERDSKVNHMVCKQAQGMEVQTYDDCGGCSCRRGDG